MSGRIRRVALPVVRVAADFGRSVVVDPVRAGRLRVERWPRGLTPVGVVGLLAYAIAVLAVVAAAPLRAVSPLVFSAGSVTLSLPGWAVGVLLALVVLALAFAQTAALHVPLWLGLSITLVTSLVVLAAGAFDGRGGAVTPAGGLAIAAALAVWVVFVVRRRRRFAWGEFAGVFAALAVGIAAPTWQTALAAGAFGLDAGPLVLTSIMHSISTLAFPAAVAAGAAVAQLSCAMATESVASVRRHLPGAAGAALLVALVVWRGWAVVDAVAAGSLPSVTAVLAACVLLAAVGGGIALLARLRGGAASGPGEVLGRFGALAPTIAALLTALVVPATFAYLFSAAAFSLGGVATALRGAGDALTTETATWGVRLLGGVVLVGLAVREARRGRSGTPEVLLGVGLCIAWTSVVALTGAVGMLWTGTALTLVVTAGAVALLVWWLVRRALTGERAAALATALLIAALFDQRSFVEDPLRALLGFTGLAFVLFGFVWAMLTGGEAANGTSRRYPRSARVLLFFANALFGVTVLAFSALARNPAVPIDLGGMAGIGDQLLGTGLLAAVLVSVLAAALPRGRRAEASAAVPESEPQRIG